MKTGSKPKPSEPEGSLRDSAFKDARAAVLLALRRERDQLADVARASRRPDALELGQQPLDVQAAGEPGGLDSRCAVEAGDLETRVLAKHPAAGSRSRPNSAFARAFS